MWLWDMSIGIIFLMGVGVAIVVGIVIVYQILSSDVLAHLPEYATLKAIGYPDGFLTQVVLSQAAILALVGFLPGLLIAKGLYWVTTLVTNIPMNMTMLRIVGVFVLSIGMCGLSGMAALRQTARRRPGRPVLIFHGALMPSPRFHLARHTPLAWRNLRTTAGVWRWRCAESASRWY